MAFSKILVHSKTIKNAKKLSTFGENDSCCLTNFLHISRTYNQINCRNIWFAKVTIILIMMAQVLFSIFFPKKTRTLMSVRFQKKSKHGSLRTKHSWNFQVCHSSLGNFRQIWSFTPGNTQLLGILNHTATNKLFSAISILLKFSFLSFNVYLLKICYL